MKKRHIDGTIGALVPPGDDRLAERNLWLEISKTIDGNAERKTLRR